MKRTILMIAAAAALLLGACSAPDEYVDVQVTPAPAASATPAAPTPEPTATPEPTPTPRVDGNAQKLSDAKAKNSDVIGWVNVPDTNIDYPILYGDNWYYNDHNFEKKKDSKGTVYSYRKEASRNNPVTAHNLRESKAMFHQLHKVQDNAQSLLTYENRVWNISVFGHHFWEVFALYETPRGESKQTILYNTQSLKKSDKKEIQAWIDYQMTRTEIDLGVQTSTNDIFLTLVTCGDTHEASNKMGRLYIFLKAVD